MKLDALQAVLRRRTAWEATDLGFSMARTWSRPLWCAWLSVMTPSVLLIWIVLWRHPFWALALSWWMKPLWGHAALHVLSRKLFAEQPNLSETLSETVRMAPRDLFGKLLWRRLVPWRTAIAPVLQLEGLSGGAARARRRVLLQTLWGPTSLLVAAALVLELVVGFGLTAAVFMALPDEPRFAVGTLAERIVDGDAPIWARVALPVIVWAVLASVEPLVVAAGFGLYLNRRTELEGWDIELSFRRLAERMAQGARSTALLLFLLALVGGGASAPASAAPAFSDVAVSEALEQVEAHPDLQTTRTVSVWRLRDTFGDTAIETIWTWLEDALDRLEGWLEAEEEQQEVTLPGLAAILEGLLWLLAGLLVVGTVLAVASRGWRSRAHADVSRPLDTVKGEAILLDPARPDDHPVAVARRHWTQGRPDAALGVLYAAAVYWLVHDRDVPVPEGATEGEVLQLARRALPSRDTALFTTITRGWQAAAYAHEPPSADEFEQACAAWPALQGAP